MKWITNWLQGRKRQCDCDCLLPSIVKFAANAQAASNAWLAHVRGSRHWAGHEAVAFDAMCQYWVLFRAMSGKSSVLTVEDQ